MQSVPTESANGYGIQPRIRALDRLDDARFERVFDRVLEGIFRSLARAADTGKGADQPGPRRLHHGLPFPPLQMKLLLS